MHLLTPFYKHIIRPGTGEKNIFHLWENKYLEVVVILVIGLETKIASGKQKLSTKIQFSYQPLEIMLGLVCFII